MKTRIITAVIAIAIVLPFIYFGGWVYALGIGIAALFAFKEVYDLRKKNEKIPVIPCLIALLALLLNVYTSFNGTNFVYGATYARLIFTTLGLLTPALFYKNDKYTANDALALIGWVLFLGMGFNSFILVRAQGLKQFVYLVSIPMMTDTFAMVLGCKIGKHKMCPKISPNKSWEGAAAGLIFGTIIPCVLYWLLIKDFNFGIVIATMILSCMGQIGDLIFSKIKRENGIKDFSNLMPGHGGCLDRLDSTIVIFMTYIFLTTVFF